MLATSSVSLMKERKSSVQSMYNSFQNVPRGFCTAISFHVLILHCISLLELDDECVHRVKEVLETILPLELKNAAHLSIEENVAINELDMKALWECLERDKIFRSMLWLRYLKNGPFF